MNVLGISGTPRENGNSNILLNHALKPFEEKDWTIQLVRSSKYRISSCMACDCCVESGECTIEDDMQEVYPYFDECDAIIVASPVYYRNISSSLAALMERYYAVKTREYLKDKTGGAIAVGRGTCGGQSIVLNIIYNWMRSCGIICVPGELNGVTAVADKPGDILTQENRLRQARVLGENILRTAFKAR